MCSDTDALVQDPGDVVLVTNDHSMSATSGDRSVVMRLPPALYSSNGRNTLQPRQPSSPLCGLRDRRVSTLGECERDGDDFQMDSADNGPFPVPDVTLDIVIEPESHNQLYLMPGDKGVAEADPSMDSAPVPDPQEVCNMAIKPQGLMCPSTSLRSHVSESLSSIERPHGLQILPLEFNAALQETPHTSTLSPAGTPTHPHSHADEGPNPALPQLVDSACLPCPPRIVKSNPRPNSPPVLTCTPPLLTDHFFVRLCRLSGHSIRPTSPAPDPMSDSPSNNVKKVLNIVCETSYVEEPVVLASGDTQAVASRLTVIDTASPPLTPTSVKANCQSFVGLAEVHPGFADAWVSSNVLKQLLRMQAEGNSILIHTFTQSITVPFILLPS